MTVHNVMISKTGQEVDAGGDSLHEKEALVTVRLNSGDIYRFHGAEGVSLAASVVAQTHVSSLLYAPLGLHLGQRSNLPQRVPYPQGEDFSSTSDSRRLAVNAESE